MDRSSATGPDESRQKTSGSLTILIPGTKWEGSGGWGPDNPLFRFANSVLAQTRGQDHTLILKWSGRNNDRSRIEAAEALRAMIAEHHFAPENKLSIVAHSHGGNVALAACHLGIARQIDTLITLNKPMLSGEHYKPRSNIERFFNINAYKDWLQWGRLECQIFGQVGYRSERN